jgi:hypothetical protein
VDPLESALGGARAPLVSSLQQLAENIDHSLGSPMLGRSPKRSSFKKSSSQLKTTLPSKASSSSALRSRALSAPDLSSDDFLLNEKRMELEEGEDGDGDGDGGTKEDSRSLLNIGGGKIKCLDKIQEDGKLLGGDELQGSLDTISEKKKMEIGQAGNKHDYIMSTKHNRVVTSTASSSSISTAATTSSSTSGPAARTAAAPSSSSSVKIPKSITYPSMVEINPEHVLFIDLSLNSVGWQGLCILSLATEKRKQMNLPPFALDLDANSKLAEVCLYTCLMRYACRDEGGRDLTTVYVCVCFHR